MAGWFFDGLQWSLMVDGRSHGIVVSFRGHWYGRATGCVPPRERDAGPFDTPEEAMDAIAPACARAARAEAEEWARVADELEAMAAGGSDG